GGEGEGRWPEAGVVTPDEMGVGAADRDRSHPGQDLVGPGDRDRHLAELEAAGLEDDERLHGLGHVRASSAWNRDEVGRGREAAGSRARWGTRLGPQAPVATPVSLAEGGPGCAAWSSP